MADHLSFKIQTVTVKHHLNDNGGNWQYLGADAVEEVTGESIKLVAMKRDNSTGGVAFPASMLTATIIFASVENDVSDNLTIHRVYTTYSRTMKSEA